MRNWLRNKLGINELEAFMHKGMEHLLNNIASANKNVALIDGRMRELELALFLLSSQECADYLKVSDSTVKRRLTEGELVGRKVGKTWVVTKLELLRYENRMKAENERNDK